MRLNLVDAPGTGDYGRSLPAAKNHSLLVMEWTAESEKQVLRSGDPVCNAPDTPQFTKVPGDEDVRALMIFERGGYEREYGPAAMTDDQRPASGDSGRRGQRRCRLAGRFRRMDLTFKNARDQLRLDSSAYL